MYLRQYPDVELQVQGIKVDPASEHFSPVDVKVKVPGLSSPVVVTFIEWRDRAKGTQRIYMCDANGAALLDVAADLRSRDITFTAYVCWDGFKNRDSSPYTAILGGEDLGAKVLAASRQPSMTC